MWCICKEILLFVAKHLTHVALSVGNTGIPDVEARECFKVTGFSMVNFVLLQRYVLGKMTVKEIYKHLQIVFKPLT